MTPTDPIYLAVILGVWSRLVIGYALAPYMDVRGSHLRRWPERSRGASRRPDAAAKRYVASLR